MYEFDKLLADLLNHKEESDMENEMKQSEDTKFVTGIAKRNGYGLYI